MSHPRHFQPIRPAPISSLWSYIRGENGTLQYTLAAVGDNLLALFFDLVRDIPDSKLCAIFNQCLSATVLTLAALPSLFNSRQIVEDLFVLAFQTRDCRGGKGERDLFYKMFLLLAVHYPRTTIALLPLVPEYGSWKDYIHLLERIDLELSLSQGRDDTACDNLRELADQILQIVATAIQQDHGKAEAHKEAALETHLALTLVTKYAPRENGSFHEHHRDFFNRLLDLVVPQHIGDRTKQKKHYRAVLSLCASHLNITESMMCAKSFASIDFSKVPSLCLKKYTKAFLNEECEGWVSSEHALSGNRHPEDDDRVKARINLMGTGKVKGGQLYPHEVLSPFMYKLDISQTGGYHWVRHYISPAQQDLIEKQWNSMKGSVVESINKRFSAKPSKCSRTSSRSECLNKLIPLVDVSGSMSGVPLEVAVSLGILISEINHPAFRDRLITFSSEPSWIDLSNVPTLLQKVDTVQRAPWQMTTDIEKAFAMIANVIRENDLREEDIPDLIIFSDMQFDAATGPGYYQTQEDRIRQLFHDLGVSLTGAPFQPPRIIFWNLRGDTYGYPSTADAENIQMLSGYSHALFHALVDGPEEQNTVKGVRRVVTPYETFRRILDDSRYDAIRKVLRASSEHALNLKQIPPSSLKARVPMIPRDPETIVNKVIGPKCRGYRRATFGWDEDAAQEIMARMKPSKFGKRNDKKAKRAALKLKTIAKRTIKESKIVRHM